MGYNAAVQVLKNAEIYKTKVSAKRDLLSESDAWTDQQQLQTIYHQVIVLDLEYALDKKVEQELWNIGFKHYISLLQEQIRDRKNPKRSDLQSLLSWSLEAASGFYISLLQELCVTFDLNVPFCDVRTKYERVNNGTTSDLLLAQSSSCNYICQYCLVHLGDIARYRNQRIQAANFYKHAITLSPNSGQPYNQLALLEASLGDKLASVYYYVQAIAVKNPFPGAITNLSSTLATCINKDEYLTEVLPRMQLPRFLSTSLQAYALLHSSPSSGNFLQPCTLAVQSANATLTALVATKALSTARLLQLIVINLYVLYYLEETKVGVEDGDGMKNGRDLVVALIAGTLNALLLPVYTMKMEEATLLEYYALPAIKIILFWIQKHPKMLQEKHFITRLQIWPSFCKLLNNLAPLVKDFNASKYHDVPLSEDTEIQGFLPLSCVFKKYNFKSRILPMDSSETAKKLRAIRIIKIGHWLANLEGNEQKLISLKSNDNDNLNFEPCCIQPDPTNDILEEIKSFTITNIEDVKEKRGGILKPQGSLEKAREERSQLQFSQQSSTKNVSNTKEADIVKFKKAPVNNVALQSILKKIEENKQVKFSSETTEKDEEKFTSQKLARTPLIVSNQTNLPLTSNRSLSSENYIFDDKSYYDGTKIRQNTNDTLQNQNLATNAKNIVQNTISIPNQFSVPPPTHNMFNYPPPNIYPNQNVGSPSQNVGQFSAMNASSQNLLQSPSFDLNISQQQKSLQNLSFPLQNQHIPINSRQQLSSQNMNIPPPSPNTHDMQLNMNPCNLDNTLGILSQSQQYNIPHYNNALSLQSSIWNNKNQTNWWPINQSLECGSNYILNRSNPPRPFESMASSWNDKPSIPSGSFSSNPPGLSGSAQQHPGHHQNLSIRQAMLNEANRYTPRVNSGFASANIESNNMSTGNLAYSLFNPSSWTPNLPGQSIRPDQTGTSRQPQSLQQLLDLQNRLKKGDT